MADRQIGLSKELPQNHKKKKNKGAKKKSVASRIFPSANKLISLSKNMKYDNVLSKDKLYKDEDNYNKNSSKIREDFSSPKREYHNSRDRTRRYSSPSDRSKYGKNDSPSIGAKRISPRKFRDDYEDSYPREHADDRKASYNEMEFPDNAIAHQNSRSSESIESLWKRIDYLTNQVNILTEENLRLNDSLHAIQYNWTVHSDSEVDIIFKKKESNEKFSHILQTLISQLQSGRISVEELSKFCSSESNEETRKPSEPDCLFEVDCSAESYENGNAFIPMYDASFHQILESPGASSSPKNTASGAKLTKCFNCEGDHNIKNCPYKLNYQKIAIARKKSRPFYSSPMRYHVQGKNENGFKPGVISDELREALNLQKNQIPPYVYRMRILDYPPGWLSEAAVESSGITVYGTDGNVEKEENCEDGEVDTSSVRVQYDPGKLIDYPGFNVPLPPDVIDESFQMGLPQLQNHQLRCVIEKTMAKPDVCPSRKRKGNWDNEKPSKIDRVEEDMDIEDADDVTNEDSKHFVSEFIPPLPESAPPPPPPPPPPGDSTDVSVEMMLSKSPEFQDDNSASAIDTFKIKSCSDFSSGTSSPSLAELEELKKKLVMELGIGLEDDPSSSASQDADSSINAEQNEDKNSDEPYIIEDEFVASDVSNELSNISDSSSTLNKNSDSPEASGQMQRTSSKSKFMTLGTPSLSRHSSYSKLPAYEQFSKNVSSHIPFENLPDSTGKYEKLKTVLRKVKDKLNSMIQ